MEAVTSVDHAVAAALSTRHHPHSPTVSTRSTRQLRVQAAILMPVREALKKLHESDDCRWQGVLCCAVLCCAVLCCAVLCCAVLCCAVLCCAVLCCAVLCCAVLCCIVPLLPKGPFARDADMASQFVASHGVSQAQNVGHTPMTWFIAHLGMVAKHLLTPNLVLNFSDSRQTVLNKSQCQGGHFFSCVTFPACRSCWAVVLFNRVLEYLVISCKIGDRE